MRTLLSTILIAGLFSIFASLVAPASAKPLLPVLSKSAGVAKADVIPVHGYGYGYGYGYGDRYYYDDYYRRPYYRGAGYGYGYGYNGYGYKRYGYGYPRYGYGYRRYCPPRYRY